MTNYEGLALRFAMVHDVIHERYPKHGRVHYQERNRLTRQRLDALAADDPAGFPLADDLAAGLERLGQPQEAVEVMRGKLARQKARGLTGRDLYTSYANLGTFLAHANLPKAVAGDQTSREHFREGIEFVKMSVEVNPQAHFGRERWQVVLAEFLLAAQNDPNVLQTFDCLGNRLDLGTGTTGANRAYGRATSPEFRRAAEDFQAPTFFHPGVSPDDPGQWDELSPIRKHVTKVGAEEGWENVPVPSHRKSVPFDEPVLGIIGMWRQGGGASPHFALALGEVMMRVGQRHIAWAAFERAARLADRFWPSADLQSFLRNHCRTRQEQLGELLSSSTALKAGSALTPVEVAALRPRFEAELAYGEGYQRAYQAYEEKQIAAGVPITDEHFFDAFNTGREPIASPVGGEDQFVWVSGSMIYEYTTRRAWAWGAFGAGLAALLVAGPLALWRRLSRA